MEGVSSWGGSPLRFAGALALALAATACSAPSVRSTQRLLPAELEAAPLSLGMLLSDDAGESRGPVRGDRPESPRVELGWSGVDLMLSTTSARRSVGSPSLSPQADPLDSALRMDALGAALSFSRPIIGQMEGGVGLGLEWIDLSGDLVSEEGSGFGVDDVFSVPLAVLRVGTRDRDFTLSALMAGIGSDGLGAERDFFDIDLLARWELGLRGRPIGHIALGWRRFDYQAGPRELDGESLRLEGPWIGLTLDF